MSATGAGYDQSVNTYSPDGRLFQVEYALKAIEGTGTAIGVKCKDGVILGVEKLLMQKMLVKGSGRRIQGIDEHIGAAIAGLMPDGRQLIARARDEARSYRQNFGEAIPPRVLNERMGSFMHIFTYYSYYRPVGASVLLAGYDEETKQAELYCAEPTGMALRYFGVAIGKGQRAAKTEIEKYKFAEKTVEEALGLVARILLTVHDDAKDKPMEVELSWVAEANGWRHEIVKKDRSDAAVAWARADIEAAENASDEDDE